MILLFYFILLFIYGSNAGLFKRNLFLQVGQYDPTSPLTLILEEELIQY